MEGYQVICQGYIQMGQKAVYFLFPDTEKAAKHRRREYALNGLKVNGEAYPTRVSEEVYKQITEKGNLRVETYQPKKFDLSS